MDRSDTVTEDGRASPVLPRNVQFNVPNTPGASVSQSQKGGTPPPPPKDIIGGVTFSAKPKLQNNLIKSTVICPKEEREQLKTVNSKAHYQLENDATGALADVINEQVKVADATSEEVTLQERILKNAVNRAIRTYNKNLGQE